MKIRLLLTVSLATVSLVMTSHPDNATTTAYPEEVHKLFTGKQWRRDISRGGAQWNEWAPWSSCSRTCGGGVAVQSRQCVDRPGDARTSRARRRRRFEGNAIPQDHILHRSGSLHQNRDSNGIGMTSHCVGLYKRFHMCNTQPCPGPPRDFRAEQCSFFNGRKFKGERHIWEPYLGGAASECALNCRAAGQGFYATLNRTVIDGTPCSKPELVPALKKRGMRGLQGVCVEGQCKAVGCDGILGSDRVPDRCGVCGGHGGSCRLISGIFTNPQLPVGYSLVATIPRGACSVNITELKHSRNYLALRNSDSSFIINGDFAINYQGDYPAAGTVFSYRRADVGHIETITAPGPTMEPIDLMVLVQHPNPGIQYQYLIPVAGTPSPDNMQTPVIAPPLLTQRKEDSSSINNELDAPAHTKEHHNSHHHHNHHHRNIISPKDMTEFKQHHKAPHHNKEHVPSGIEPRSGPYGAGVLGTESERPAIPHKSKVKRRKFFIWRFNGFSSCSRSCGGGNQTPTFSCVREHTNNEVSVKRCGSIERPIIQPQRCNMMPCPAKWKAGEWSTCSESCGSGIQTRDIYCEQETAVISIKVNNGACLDTPLPTKQRCDMPSCSSSNINLSNNLDPNSNKIDSEYRPPVNETNDSIAPVIIKRPSDYTPNYNPSHHRVNYDHGRGNHQESRNHVLDHPRPHSSEGHTPNNGMWIFTEWTQKCSEECGTGIQTRSVLCGQFDGSFEAESDTCDAKSKPDESRACSSDKRCGGKWFSGPWSECLGNCGAGKQIRDVVCVAKIRGSPIITINMTCSAHEKPETERPCTHGESCYSRWFSSDWTQCSRSCGTGIQKRVVKCLDQYNKLTTSCKEDALPQTRRLCNTHHCPHTYYNQQGAATTEALSTDHTEHKGDNNNYRTEPNHVQDEPVKHSGPKDCTDSFTNCHLVVQARLCKYKFYINSCCLSCRRAPPEA